MRRCAHSYPQITRLLHKGPDLKVQVLTGLKNRARSLGQERSAYLQQKVYRNAVQGVEIQQMAQ
jgi:hypothetical protein